MYYCNIFQQLFKFIPRYRFDKTVEKVSGDRFPVERLSANYRERIKRNPHHRLRRPSSFWGRHRHRQCHFYHRHLEG